VALLSSQLYSSIQSLAEGAIEPVMSIEKASSFLEEMTSTVSQRLREVLALLQDEVQLHIRPEISQGKCKR